MSRMGETDYKRFLNRYGRGIGFLSIYLCLKYVDVEIYFGVNQCFYIVFRLPNDHIEYDLLTNETFYNNSETKIYQSSDITDMLPYKQYDLIRDASSDTFLFSFVLEDELDSNMAIPINMTDKHFSVLKYKIRLASYLLMRYLIFCMSVKFIIFIYKFQR